MSEGSNINCQLDIEFKLFNAKPHLKFTAIDSQKTVRDSLADTLVKSGRFLRVLGALRLLATRISPIVVELNLTSSLASSLVGGRGHFGVRGGSRPGSMPRGVVRHLASQGRSASLAFR